MTAPAPTSELAKQLRETAGQLINGVLGDGAVSVAMLCEAADALEGVRASEVQREPVVDLSAATKSVASLYELGRTAQARLNPADWEGLRQSAALEIWHRFADSGTEEWADETHKAEYLMCADAILGHAFGLEAIAREAQQPEGDSKLVYVKRWRTIVRLPVKYADEIVDALRASPVPSASDGHAQEAKHCGNRPSVNAYASEYEYRGDQDYVPSEGERAMIEDAIEGYLSLCGDAR